MVELLHHGPAQGFELAATLTGQGRLRLNRGDVAAEVVFAFHDAVDTGALLTLDQHLDRTVGQLEHLQDGGHATHREHVVDCRLVLGGSFLGHQHDAPL